MGIAQMSVYSLGDFIPRRPLFIQNHQKVNEFFLVFARAMAAERSVSRHCKERERERERACHRALRN